MWKFIKAKYPGKCPFCHDEYDIGDYMFAFNFDDGGHILKCMECIKLESGESVVELTEGEKSQIKNLNKNEGYVWLYNITNGERDVLYYREHSRKPEWGFSVTGICILKWLPEDELNKNVIVERVQPMSEPEREPDYRLDF